MALNENIKAARIKKKLTQKELADHIGVSHNIVSDWENGKHKPDVDTIMKLCKELDVDANYMFDYKEIPTVKNLKEKLKEALINNDYFDGDDLSEENFNKLLKFIEKNKEFIIDKKE